MKKSEDLLILKKEIEKTLDILEAVHSFYEEFRQKDMPALGKRMTAAIVIAQVLDNFYTCLETLFLRISRFFENTLDQKRWHSDLLEKMALNIEGIREQVVSPESYPLLLELLRFRHFRRYYFELGHDWDKLEFLQKKYQECRPLIRKDLKRFIQFLDALQEE